MGERNQIKIRVRTAMAAQAQIEGGFWAAGRATATGSLIQACIGIRLKAADDKRLRASAIDEDAAVVVRRIFAEFAATDLAVTELTTASTVSDDTCQG